MPFQSRLSLMSSLPHFMRSNMAALSTGSVLTSSTANQTSLQSLSSSGLFCDSKNVGVVNCGGRFNSSERDHSDLSTDRYSSSIAALRLRAREYEVHSGIDKTV